MNQNMDVVEFKDLKELYERMNPALFAKQAEMKRAGYPYVQADDIWNYLRETKWKRACDLSLADMVDDVLNSNDYEIDSYLRQKYHITNRRVYFEE